MKIRNITLAILIPIIILLSNFSLLAFSEKYYQKQYIKNNVYSEIPKEQLNEATTQLINYLKKGGNLEGDYFNEKEKEHLKDVRHIIKILLIVLFASIIIVIPIIMLGLMEDNRALGKALMAGGLITIALIVALLVSLTNFQYTFTKFHEILFSNNLWVLNPETDKLIVMFPENFFYDITQNIAVRSLLTALATALIGLMLVLVKHKHGFTTKNPNIKQKV